MPHQTKVDEEDGGGDAISLESLDHKVTWLDVTMDEVSIM